MKSIIVANWKMNPATYKEAKALLEATRSAAEPLKKVSLIVAPPSLYLKDLRALYKGKKILFAAQNAYFGETGSFTGEVSMAQVRDIKATHVLIGHAERRALGETNDDVSKKILAALGARLIPILCIGETKRTQEGHHYIHVKAQLTSALRDVPAAKISGIVMAYEPVWAIGSDKPMGPREMHEMAIFIRKTVVEMHGNTGMNLKILYGGAIDETNAVAMLHGGDVNGLLVGRASTNKFKFKALLEAVDEA